jgi:hypothetical protein
MPVQGAGTDRCLGGRKKMRMTFDRTGAVLALIAALVLTVPAAVWAGGTGFGDDDDDTSDEGPSYFGFVREVNGAGIADAKVTAELKDRGALVTRTDIMGVYKIPGFGKDVDPKDVNISCAKDGFKESRTMRQPRASDDSKDPIEIECYLQRK